MPTDYYETKEDAPDEPTDPNEVRIALSWLFSSPGTLNFEDSPWTADFDGDNGLEFHDETNQTVAYIPPGTDGDITGGSSSDTRTDVADDGTTQVTDVEEIDFAANVSVTDNGDGTVSIDATDTDTDTRTDVSDSGTTVVSDVSDINFAEFLSVTDDGDGTVTVDGQDETVRTRQANIPLTEIADANTAVGLRKLVPSGKTLRILEVGVEDDTGSAPTGLTIEVRDLTNATNIVSQNTRHNEGSPIASKSGAIDVAFRVNNSTGGSINASGYVLYTME